MKYSTRYYVGNPLNREADEIIIKYTKKSTGLLDFVQKYAEEQRIVIDITTIETMENIEENYEYWTVAEKVHPNFAVLLSVTQKEIIPALKELNLKYFFYEYADSWDALTYQISEGVSDVYIANEFGFNMQFIWEYCNEHNVEIRVFPNVAQSACSYAEGLDTLKFFFVRPEDVEEYGVYVSTFEFFGPLDKQYVLYKIYTSKRWLGNLKNLILGFDKNIFSNMIAPNFAERRMKCRKKCAYGACDFCDHIEDLAKVYEENNLQFTGVTRLNEDKRDEEDVSDESNSTSIYDGAVSKDKISESYSN